MVRGCSTPERPSLDSGHTPSGHDWLYPKADSRQRIQLVPRSYLKSYARQTRETRQAEPYGIVKGAPHARLTFVGRGLRRYQSTWL